MFQVLRRLFVFSERKAVLFAALFLAGLVPLSISNFRANSARVAVSMDFGSEPGLRGAAVLFLAPDGKAVPCETAGGAWTADGYIGKVLFAFKPAAARQLRELRVSIGERSYRFTGGEAAAFPRADGALAAGVPGDLVVELPAGVRAPGSVIYGDTLKDVLNWRGDGALAGAALASVAELLLALFLLAALSGLWDLHLRARLGALADGLEGQAGYAAREKAAGAIVCAGAVTVFNLMFFNRFFPVPEGWFTLYGQLILDGKVPYRDFYLFIPPLHTLVMTALTAVFSDHLIWLRLLGLAMMTAEAGMIYFIFLRLFSPAVSMLVSFFSVLVYETHCAFIFYDYNDFVNLYVLGLTLLTLRFIESGGGIKRRMAEAAVIGAVAGACVLTKHTVGVLLFAGCAAVLCAAELGRAEGRPWRALAAFMAGTAAAMLPVLLWLQHNGALAPMMSQLFLERGEKGTLLDILFRWLPFFFSLKNAVNMAVVAGLFFALRVRPDLRRPGEKAPGGARLMAAYAACMAAAVLLPYFFPWLARALAGSRTLNELYKFSAFLSALAAFGALAYALYSIARRQEKGLYPLTAVLASACVLCLSSVMSSGLSIPAYGTLLASGFTAGALISGRSRLRDTRAFFSVIFILLVFYMTSFRLSTIYGRSPHSRWWGVGDQGSVWDPGVKPAAAALAGLRISPRIAAAIDGVEAVIESRTSKDDYIFAFPHTPIFYLLSGRKCPTFSLIHWYDTVNSKVCARDAETLLKTRPKVIVCLHYLEGEDLRAHEKVYNDGRELEGHRTMMRAIVELVSDKKLYRFEKSFAIERDCVIDVYSRI